MNRRELLGLFGVGAIVVPAAAKLDLAPPMARIIEPPKVELVEAGALQELKHGTLCAIPFGELNGVLMLQGGGREYTVHCRCVHVSTRVDWLDVTSASNAHVARFGAHQLNMRFDVIADPEIKSRPVTK